MTNIKEDIPLDGKLLGEAIIELNISRHNVSIYPKNHPIVEHSLNRSFDFLQRLFELRHEVTIAIAKDTIVVDNYALDRKNPVFKDFALCLNSMNIAFIKIKNGVTRNEIYSFHNFLSQHKEMTSTEELRVTFEKCGLTHIIAIFIDYSEFSLVQGRNGLDDREGAIWERYIYELLGEKFHSEDVTDLLNEATHEQLAKAINNLPNEAFTKDSYDNVITSYIKKSSERAFTGTQLKKLFDFINELRPEIKRQFLSSAVNTVSGDLDNLQQALVQMPAEEIIKLLGIINDQSLMIPESLKNVLDKFSAVKYRNYEFTSPAEGFMNDDILLSPEMTTLLSTANFKVFISDEYQMEMQQLLRYHPRKVDSGWFKAYEKQLSDTFIETLFHQTLLELTASNSTDIITIDEMVFFEDSIKEHLQQFVETGQYRQVYETLTILEAHGHKQHIQDMVRKILEFCRSTEFIVLLVNSFRTVGRQMREDAFLLCGYYGEKVVASLIDALADEDSQTVRRFLLMLIKHLGSVAVTEAVKHLNHNRWYIQRNMLFILYECGDKEALREARPYCKHENSKVRFEAIKCLLAANDSYGIRALKDNLRSDSKSSVKKAISLAGAFRLKEVVPDLIALMKKRTITSADYEDKILVAKALGRIGGPEALETLNNILLSKTVLFKNSLEKLKIEIHNILIKHKNAFDEEITGTSIKMPRGVIKIEYSEDNNEVPA